MPKLQQITDTTDGFNIGVIFDPTNRPIILTDWEFYPDRVTDLKNGKFRFSNTNYIIDSEEINND